jgi:hypothetical protein
MLHQHYFIRKYHCLTLHWVTFESNFAHLWIWTRTWTWIWTCSIDMYECEHNMNKYFYLYMNMNMNINMKVMNMMNFFLLSFLML